MRDGGERRMKITRENTASLAGEYLSCQELAVCLLLRFCDLVSGFLPLMFWIQHLISGTFVVSLEKIQFL